MDYLGLSSVEVSKRLGRSGLNELPKEKVKSGWTIFFEVIREPMLLLLVLSVVLYFFLGDVLETVLLSFSVGVILFISYIQERRTENALAALKNLAVPMVVAVRDGKKVKVERKNVVVGDLLWIVEGERVGADGVAIEAKSLMVDESLLTGESVPIEKKMGEKLYMGTMVVRGEVLIEVEKIGVETEMGKIGKSLESIESEETFLQKQTKQTIRTIGFWSIMVCLILVVYFGLSKKEWIEGILAGITAGMALLPEEFPVVLTVFLSFGAWRISKEKVLTRKMAAIETLGSITTLCVDKTGTLTENMMKVEMVADLKGIEKTSKLFGKRWACVLETAVMASSDDPFDPMEIAIQNLAKQYKVAVSKKITPIKDYPLGKMFTMARGWGGRDGKYSVSLKGSPEGVINKCLLSSNEKALILKQVEIFASEGMRVIGVAVAEKVKVLPKKKSDIRYKWLGLLGIKDPLRDGVAEALPVCETAGIKVVMITGDYPITAMRIARDAGMQVGEKNVLEGVEIEKMEMKALREKLFDTRVCARIRPEQKLRIVEALKENGEVVGMTGDGVNDAPALKMADVGVSMGKRGTDVARESSDLVLLNDDFESIVSAIEMGRRIYINIKKAMMYLISVHIPIAGVTLLPILTGEQMFLLPIHIVLMELIIDPMASIVFEIKRQKGIMRSMPRPKNENLFGKKDVLKSVGRGAIMLSASVIVYAVLKLMGGDMASMRKLMFLSLIFGNILLAIWYLNERVVIRE